MHCEYCFYCDEMKSREQSSYGMMSFNTLEQVVKKALSAAEGICNIAFQGGEPTLCGLDFYEQVVSLEEKYNVHQVKIQNALQTNGYGLDAKWAEFFASHNFLLGISLDGRKNTHNAYRHGINAEDSFEEVIKTLHLFDQYKVDYNILTVVNDKTVKQPRKIYELYRKNNWKYLQFIPCLSPLSLVEGQKTYSPNPGEYGDFLNELFDCWYVDLRKNEQPYIRQFENYVGILLGHAPDCCDQSGSCQIQYVIEADGSVYPCDFYAIDSHLLGNLVTDTFEEIDKRRKEIRFMERSVELRKQCSSCPYYPICRGGCFRHWKQQPSGEYRNMFCEGYRLFFGRNVGKLQEIARNIAHY